MKLALICVLLMVPLVTPAPQKKNLILDALFNLFHVDHLKALVVDLMDELGSDESEHDCETDCNLLVTNQVHQATLGTIGHSACPLVCHSFQELVHFFGLHIPSTTLAPGQVPV